MKPIYTPGPYSFRLYATDDDPAELRKLGLEPVRLLTNEGQVAIMAGDRRVALVDCQTEFKRGQGYKTACAERDANAKLFSAAYDLLKALQQLYDDTAEYITINKLGDVHHNFNMQQARDALAKAKP